MDYIYVPRRLISAANEIALQHTVQREINNITPNEKLKKLIDKIVSLELYRVKTNAFALSETDVLLIAGYLPHNFYKVDMKNLLLVVTYRSSPLSCKILYQQWQNSYNNKQCNQYMSEQLKMNEPLIMLIRKHNLTEDVYDEILTSNNIPQRFGKECVNRQFPNYYSLADKMNYFGVRQDSKLYHDCQLLFYTFCSKKDYLQSNKIELLNTIQKYNENDLKVFLYRFLIMLSLDELESFSELANYFYNKYGEITTSKYIFFFKEATDEIREKYNNWLNAFKINQYFKKDERSRFWKQYEFISIKKYNSSNAVLMEFELYYAIEFLGDSMGPIYFYHKNIFDHQIRKWMTRFDNSDLRQQLYHNPNLYAYRKEHRGYWQKEVDAKLIKDHITKRVKN